MIQTRFVFLWYLVSETDSHKDMLQKETMCMYSFIHCVSCFSSVGLLVIISCMYQCDLLMICVILMLC